MAIVSMSVVYVLTTPIPKDGENATMDQIRRRAKWDKDDYVCRGLILKDASRKMFLVSNFTNYKITDSRPVMEQYNKLFDMLERFTQHKMNMDEAIHVSCIIDKLPPSWKDFMHTLKHNKEALTLVELAVICALRSLSGLGHVHFKRMQDISKDMLISAFDIDTEKCKTCMLNKITKKPFQNVKCETEVLELIRSDLCNLHATPSLGNKKYFVTFIDDASRFSSVHRPSQRSLINRTEDIDGLVVPEEATEEAVTQQPEPELRKGKRNKTPKNCGPEFQLYLIKGTRDEDVALWKEANNDEMDSIMGNNTLVLADLPLGFKPLGCKWIFKRKLKVDETIEKFKERLVIQGFRQKSWIDYFDTFALVACISTIRLLIAMESIHNLIICQMDVKTTFLNGKLDEEVYMNQPRGFIMHDNENKVCKLIKSLYGLKQAPKKWHQKFDEVVLSNGYLLSQAEKYEFLSSKFSMKDMREADVILSIRTKHESNGIAISQSHYIKKVLKKFNYFDCTLVSTPMDTSEKLMPNNGEAVSQLEYSRVIGCLMYAMTCTRPDIAFVVGKLS
ncbi:zinc finger, CCHC-type containing protein, partial [Tanacetum coccineum]